MTKRLVQFELLRESRCLLDDVSVAHASKKRQHVTRLLQFSCPSLPLFPPALLERIFFILH